MAENDENIFTHSSSLFLKDNGAEMRFYLRPCAMKARIRPLVEHGGGRVSSKMLPGAIKLAEPDSKQVGYFSTDLIFDSVKKNICQNLEDYRIVMPSPSSTTSNTVSVKPRRKAWVVNVKASRKPRRGRRIHYTPEEDSLIIDYVRKNASASTQLSGNVFWQGMKGITWHSWQSMRTHYLKHLKPKTETKFESIHVHHTNGTSASKKPGKGEITISKAFNRIRSPKKSSVRERSSGSSVDSDDEFDREEAKGETAGGDESDASAEFDARLQRLAEKEQDENGSSSCTESQGGNKSSDCEVTSSQDIKKSANKHKKNPQDDFKTSQSSASKKRGESPSNTEGNDESTGDEDKQHPRSRAKTGKRKLTGIEDTVSSTPPAKQRGQYPQAGGDAGTSGQSPSFKPVWSQFKKLQDMTIDLKLSDPLLLHALFVASGSVQRAKHYLLHGELEEGIEPWSFEEDEVLCSQDKDAISKLKRKRGRTELLERMDFFEQVKSTQVELCKKE